MRTVAVVSVGRSDYSLLLPILKAIRASATLRLRFIVAGPHLTPAGAGGLRQMKADGIPIADTVEMTLAADTPTAVAVATGLGVLGFGRSFGNNRPDVLLLLGDRYEMHAAAVAAAPHQIPIAHVHGGELTLGAFDDALRHSLTKLSHLHFVAHPDYAARVLQMGEEGWRVQVCGAPGLDGIRQTRLLDRAQFARRCGFTLPPRFLLATFHPETLEPEATANHCRHWLQALTASGCDVVFTRPNADPGHAVIDSLITAYLKRHPRSRIAESLGPAAYYTALRHARAMVGNSSSGLLEAASFRLPVVNVGSRQQGRLRPSNVIDCGPTRAAIQAAVARALSPQFQQAQRRLTNPFGDGHAAERIVARLASAPLGRPLLQKKFCDQTRAGDGTQP